MAINITNITSGSNSTGATSYATASISPVANRLYLAAFYSRTGITANPNQPTLSGGGLTWDVIGSVVFDDTSSSRRRVTLFRSLGASPSAGALTFDEGGQSQTSADWVVDEVTGMDTGGTNGSGAIVQSATNYDDTATVATITITLAAFSNANNVAYGAFGGAGGTPTAGSGYTVLGSAQDTVSGAVATEWDNANNTSVPLTWSGNVELGGVGIEIKAVSSGTLTINTFNNVAISENLVVQGPPSATISVIQTAGQSPVTSSTITFTLSTTPVPGNLLVAFCSYSQYSNARTINTPAGWNKIDDVTGSTSSGNVCSMACFWYLVQSSDGTSWPFTINSGAVADFVSGAIYELAGTHSSNPIILHGSSQIIGTVTAAASPQITPNVGGMLALYGLALDKNVVTFSSVDAGWTERQSMQGDYHPTFSGTRDALTVDTTTPIQVTVNVTGSSASDGGVMELLLVAPAASQGSNLSKISGVAVASVAKIQSVLINSIYKVAGVFQNPLLATLLIGRSDNVTASEVRGIQIPGLPPGPINVHDNVSHLESTTASEQGVTTGKAFGFAANAFSVGGLTTTQQATWMADFKSLGMSWVRIDADWNNIEPSQGNQNWSNIDQAVAQANAAGVNVLIIPTYCPGWANGGNSFGFPPTNPNTFATFCTQLVNRYAPQGVHAYEVWNEPNNTAFWGPSPNAAAYVNLLKPAYTAIHAADPAATVISGGVCPCAIQPITYIQQMYAAGAAGFFDALGIHPYTYPADPLNPGTVWMQMSVGSPNAVSLMQANGDGAKKIWNTEFGAPTSTAGNAVTQAQQATQLANAINAWQTYSWSGNFFIYSYMDTGSEPSPDNEVCFGITLSSDGRTKNGNKPAYASVQTAISN